MITIMYFSKSGKIRLEFQCFEKWSIWLSNLPPIKHEKRLKTESEYPTLALDISCAFSNIGIPLKTQKDIMKANLFEVNDREFLNRISIKEIDSDDKENKDLLIDVKWILKNETNEDWPK